MGFSGGYSGFSDTRYETHTEIGKPRDAHLLPPDHHNYWKYQPWHEFGKDEFVRMASSESGANDILSGLTKKIGINVSYSPLSYAGDDSYERIKEYDLHDRLAGKGYKDKVYAEALQNASPFYVLSADDISLGRGKTLGDKPYYAQARKDALAAIEGDEFRSRLFATRDHAGLDADELEAVKRIVANDPVAAGMVLGDANAFNAAFEYGNSGYERREEFSKSSPSPEILDIARQTLGMTPTIESERAAPTTAPSVDTVTAEVKPAEALVQTAPAVSQDNRVAPTRTSSAAEVDEAATSPRPTNREIDKVMDLAKGKDVKNDAYASGIVEGMLRTNGLEEKVNSDGVISRSERDALEQFLQKSGTKEQLNELRAAFSRADVELGSNQGVEASSARAQPITAVNAPENAVGGRVM
jgi:hypothetical protein